MFWQAAGEMFRENSDFARLLVRAGVNRDGNGQVGQGFSISDLIIMRNSTFPPHKELPYQILIIIKAILYYIFRNIYIVITGAYPV